MKSRFTKLLLAGLVTVTIAGSTVPTNAAGKIKDTWAGGLQMEEDVWKGGLSSQEDMDNWDGKKIGIHDIWAGGLPIDEAMLLPEIEDYPQYLKENKVLTEAEAKRLAESMELIEEQNIRIAEMEVDIDTHIRETIGQELDQLTQQIDQLNEGVRPLWEKLYDQESEDQADLEDLKAYIEGSRALTEKEKDSLLDVVARIDDIEDEIDAQYRKVQASIRPFLAQIDAAEQRLEEIYQGDSDIWQKIDAFELRGFDETIAY